MTTWASYYPSSRITWWYLGLPPKDIWYESKWLGVWPLLRILNAWKMFFYKKILSGWRNLYKEILSFLSARIVVILLTWCHSKFPLLAVSTRNGGKNQWAASLLDSFWASNTWSFLSFHTVVLPWYVTKDLSCRGRLPKDKPHIFPQNIPRSPISPYSPAVPSQHKDCQ